MSNSILDNMADLLNAFNNNRISDTALGLGFILILVFILFFLVISFVGLISKSFLFKKAGRNPWLVLVPFYGNYVFCDIVLGIEWFGLVYCLWPLALFSLASNAEWIRMMFSFAVFIMNVVLNINLAKRFNKSTGFAIGLIILPIIFYPILAFGKSKYIPIDQEKNNNDDSNFERDQKQDNYDKINDYAHDQKINFSSNNNKDDEDED